MATDAPPLTVPTVLVAGTYGYRGRKSDALAWWYPGSGFWREADSHKIQLLGRHDPFEWSTTVGGITPGRAWVDWKSAGQALRWFALSHHYQSIDVIAHSHGGQVAAYCAYRRYVRGFSIRRLITVGMPVREDMRVIYNGALMHVEQWIHIWTPGDLWQRWGGGNGPVEVVGVRNIEVPNQWWGWDRHTQLLEPERWTRAGWWAYLTI